MKPLRESKRFPAEKVIIGAVFCLYLIVLFSLLLFKKLPLLPQLPGLSPALANSSGQPNLIPLKSIRLYWNADQSVLPARVISHNLLGNILVLFPFGLLSPFLCRRSPWFWRCFWAGLSAILAIELIQLISGLGVWDIDDLILNTAGLLLGLVSAGLIKLGLKR